MPTVRLRWLCGVSGSVQRHSPSSGAAGIGHRHGPMHDHGHWTHFQQGDSCRRHVRLIAYRDGSCRPPVLLHCRRELGFASSRRSDRSSLFAARAKSSGGGKSAAAETSSIATMLTLRGAAAVYLSLIAPGASANLFQSGDSQIAKGNRIVNGDKVRRRSRRASCRDIARSLCGCAHDVYTRSRWERVFVMHAPFIA